MLPQDTNPSLVPPAGANGMAKGDSFAKHSFPPDGLVALSRVAYEQITGTHFTRMALAGMGRKHAPIGTTAADR